MIILLKIGGNLINDTILLNQVLYDFSKIKARKILVHGGGRAAEELLKNLGIKPKMYKGRRITDEKTLDIVTMVYAGLLNKKIVAKLQSYHCNAIGLTGADGNTIQAKKRSVKEINYGFAGDLNTNSINHLFIQNFLDKQIIPVFCAITHDKKGQLLNTNADTIACSIAKKMAEHEKTRLIYCFDKKGVLIDRQNENSFIPEISSRDYALLKKDGTIVEGMIPKLDNAFQAISQGVKEVILCNPDNIISLKEKTVLCP